MENCWPNWPKIVSPELLINGQSAGLLSTGLMVTEPSTIMEFAGGGSPHETIRGPGSGPRLLIVTNALAPSGPTVEPWQLVMVSLNVVAIIKILK